MLLDDQIVIFETLCDCVALPLHSVVIDFDHSHQLLKSHISDIIFLVGQEATQDVNSEDSETLTSLNLHNSTHTLREHRVAWVLACLRVGCDLGEHVTHLVGGLSATFANLTKKLDYLNLEERILDPAKFVLRGISTHEQILKLAV